MATKKPVFFQDDASDSDSISVTSTISSDQEEEYNVEKILAEDQDIIGGTGEPQYLLKWEGYPLHRSTWEPKEHIGSDLLLREWEQHKRLVEQGKAVAFDIEEFHDARDLAYRETEARKTRRNAKRRKLGIHVPTSPGQDDDEEDSVQEEATRKKRVKTTEVKRKGVAQRVKAQKQYVTVPNTRNAVPEEDDGDDSEGSESGSNSSGGDSLFDQLRGEAAKGTKKTKATPIVPKRQHAPPKPTGKPVDTSPKVTASAARAAAARQKIVPKPITTPAASSSGARKSATSTSKPTSVQGTAMKTAAPVASKNVMANWNAAPPKRKPRAVSGDQAAKGFTHLAVQNTVKKYSAMERAPDVNALTTIDPKTGRPIASTAAVQVVKAAPTPSSTMTDIMKNMERELEPVRLPPKTTVEVPKAAPTKIATGEIHGAYHRRTPPRDDDARPVSPDSPRVRRTVSFAADTRQEDILPVLETRPSSHKIRETCRYWRDGDCKYTAASCRWYHTNELPRLAPDEIPYFYNPGVGKKALTCFYWRTRGRCKKPDDECEYAHFDTGINAPPPRGFKEPTPPPPPREVVTDPAPAPTSATKPPQPPRKLQPSEVTCYYWQLGRCKHSDEDCSFAHYDTGIYAGRPGTFRKGSMAANAVQSYEEAQMQDSDPNVFNPPIQQMDATVFHPERAAMLGLNTNVPSGAGSYEQLTSAISYDSRVPTAGGPSEVFLVRRHTEPALQAADDLRQSLISTPVVASVVHAEMAEPIERTDSMDPNLAEDLSMVTDGEDELEKAAADMILTLKGSLADGKVFLMMPKSRTSELQIIKKWFESKDCKVYHSASPGGWNEFRRSHWRSSLLVVHPETPLWKISGLQNYL